MMVECPMCAPAKPKTAQDGAWWCPLCDSFRAVLETVAAAWRLDGLMAAIEIDDELYMRLARKTNVHLDTDTYTREWVDIKVAQTAASWEASWAGRRASTASNERINHYMSEIRKNANWKKPVLRDE